MSRYLSIFFIVLFIVPIFSFTSNLPVSNTDSLYKNLEQYPVEKNITFKQVVHNIYLYTTDFFSENVVKIFLFAISLGFVFILINQVLQRDDKRKFLSNARLSVMDKELKIACNYMEKNFRDPELSVNSICEALVTGPAFLEVLFSNELGMSIDEFLDQVRMNRALDIIKKEKNITIDDLILRIGFSNNNDFFNSFEKVTGKSFSEYKRSQH